MLFFCKSSKETECAVIPFEGITAYQNPKKHERMLVECNDVHFLEIFRMISTEARDTPKPPRPARTDLAACEITDRS